MEGNETAGLEHGQPFDDQQLEEIAAGRAAGLDVSKYANPSYHALLMHQIRLGLESGVDVSAYAAKGYDWEQLEELRLGLERGMDVSLYAIPALTGYQMRQLRKAKLSGYDLSEYRNLPAEIIRQIRKARKSGVDLEAFLDKDYSARELMQIRLALENGTDITPYLDKNYTPEALKEIRLGIEAGVDVSVYVNAAYNWHQMRELRLGLMKRVDVTVYAHPGYHWQQMQELRLGMERGIDISCYKNPKLSPLDMRRLRKEIEAQLPGGAGPEPAEQETIETEEPGEESEQEELEETKTAGELLADIRQQFADIHIEEMEEIAGDVVLSLQMEVRLTEDGMQAYAKLPYGSGRRYTAGEIVKSLMDSNVVYGLNQDAISRIAKGELYDEEVLVAEGTPMKNGEDGYYEYMFKTEIPAVPAILPDGSVDYKNVQFFEYINAGDTVALYHPATAGTAGYTVEGKVLPAKRGLEQQVLTGKHIHADGDNVTYVADENGKIELNGYEIVISNVLEVDEVNYSTGNVQFGGSVHIRGNVTTGMVVDAGEDIVIDGHVEGATIRCGRNLLLKRGVLGGGTCQIRAEGSVSGKFFENANIYAVGDITGNYALNCHIFSGGEVTISGKRGVILGGSMHAMRGLSVQNIGNRAEVVTYISLGVTREMVEQRKKLDELLVKVEGELSVFYKARQQFEQKFNQSVLRTIPTYMKVMQAISIKDGELRKYTGDRERILQDMKDLEGVKAQVRGEIFEGVKIAINGYVWQAKHAKYLELHVAGDHVGLFTFDGKAPASDR